MATRVLLLSNMYPGQGDPQAGSFVERNTLALRARGLQVDVVALTSRARGRVRTPAKYASLTARAALASRRRYDVVLAHYLVPTGAIARLVARARRIPYVVVAHGTDVANAEQPGRLQRATARVVADAAAVVAVSEPLGRRLEEAVGAIGERLHFISAGVDLDGFHDGDRDVAAAALGWDGPHPRLVFVGNLVEVKNLERLLSAFAAVHARRGGCLALVGGGPLDSALRQQAEALGIAEAVRLVGPTDADEVARWLRAADVGCLVSLREGLGLAAIEALACGRPVVVSRAAGASQVVDPGVTGELCDPLEVDSIATAIESAAMLDPGAAALAAAAPYAVEREAERLARVLEQVVAVHR